jgi:hypothetical protein
VISRDEAKEEAQTRPKKHQEMTPDETRTFYEAAITASAILSGFNGTFLSFRIQREANYYRQPVLDFKEKRGVDAGIGLSQFNSSLLLIILGTLCSMMFGVFMPLAALSRWGRYTPNPALILAGIVASGVLVMAYFFNELIHYKILKWSRLSCDLKGWGYEWLIVISGVLLACLGFVLTYRIISH